MHYQINFGVPEFKIFYDSLVEKALKGKINKGETRLFKQITKVIGLLSTNPKYNSLNSHEIADLTNRYCTMYGCKCKVWQSYLENNTPAAGRIYWCYGPGKSEITIIGLEPHPEDKKNAGYLKVKLSKMP